MPARIAGKCVHPGHYPPGFGLKLLTMFQRLLSVRHDPAPVPADMRKRSALEIFSSTSWGDCWREAEMPEVLQCLFGNTSLDLPPEWRVLFPGYV